MGLTSLGIPVGELGSTMDAKAKEIAEEFGFTTCLVFGVVGDTRQTTYVNGISGRHAEAVLCARRWAKG